MGNATQVRSMLVFEMQFSEFLEYQAVKFTIKMYLNL